MGLLVILFSFVLLDAKTQKFGETSTSGEFLSSSNNDVSTR